MTARIRGVNSDGNPQCGFIADATVTLSDGTITTISGSSRRNRGEAIKNMWEDWKNYCEEFYGKFIYCRNEGSDFHN